MNNLLKRYRDQSDPLRTERGVELLVVALVVLLLAQLLWSAARLLFPAMPGAVEPTADAMRVVAATAAELPGAEQRAEIRSRPLFWESRRSLVTEAEPEPVQVVEDKPAEVRLGKIRDVTLTGVFGSGKSAGIIYLAKGKERRIMVGESVNGWTLDTVEPTRAVFQGNGNTAELDLKQGTIEFVETAPSDSGKTGAATGESSKAEPEKERTLTLGGRR
ncbi:hypothetical protein [Haliea sp. E17]|uniref:hypothetical protein n=1 Tax=Haliea sp. E17 TaxID=3401576 RepID=UPI003AAEB268